MHHHGLHGIEERHSESEVIGFEVDPTQSASEANGTPGHQMQLHEIVATPTEDAYGGTINSSSQGHVVLQSELKDLEIEEVEEVAH